MLGVLALAVSGCVSNAASKPAAKTRASTGAADLSVSSSLEEGAVLAEPVIWSAQAHGVAVDHIDFFIDGTKRWTERRAPYVFNDDGQFLAPWLLSPGSHVLRARVTTVSGRTADSVVHVMNGAPAAAPAGLSGSFVRRVAKADLDRTADEPGRGTAGGVLPTGIWRMSLSNGLLTFDDPDGSGGGEAFSATTSRITMWGWPQWVLPLDRRGEFCEHERPGTFAWSLSGTRLVISGGGGCADRDALFVGAWQRSS